MEIVFSFLMAFATLVVACPSPFNNWRFSGNESADSAMILHKMLLDGNIGWSEVVSNHHNPRHPWPAREAWNGQDNRITNIHYCYIDLDAEVRHNHYVKQAWKAWEDVIGPPDHEGGHRLKFTPSPFKGSERFCYKMRFTDDDPWEVNSDVDDRAVFIDNFRGKGSGARAKEGFIMPTIDKSKGPHRIQTNADTLDSRYIVMQLAHELGHVWGLWHEHQRETRDNFVHFECSNLDSYSELKERLQTHPIDPSHTIDRVCKDANLGYLYGFGACDYSTELYVDNLNYQWFQHHPGYYDEASVMHYNSWQGNTNKKDLSKIENLVLVKWKDRHTPGFKPPDRSQQRTQNLFSQM